MSERFYTNWPLQPGPVELTGPEAHHLATVCRLCPGDQVCLFNGDGHEYLARIESVAKRSVALEVLARETPQRELPFTLRVAVPLPKGDRAQFMVEKLTEIGVAEVVPLATRRSVIHPREGKLEKLQRYVIEASKQCGRNVLMKVAALADWEAYCRAENLGEMKLLAHPLASRERERPVKGAAHAVSGPAAPLTACAAPPVAHAPGSDISIPSLTLSALIASAASVTIAVGPEGGFTDEEVSLARQAGWQLCDLGPRILRVETAA